MTSQPSHRSPPPKRGRAFARRILALQRQIGDLNLTRKLNLGFGVLVVLTLLVAGRSYWGSLKATINIKRTQDFRVPTALTSANAQANLLRMLSNLRGYMATGKSELRDRYQESRQAFENDLTAMVALSQSGDFAQNQQRLATLQASYREWSAIPDQLFALRDNAFENQPALQLLEQQGEVPIKIIENETQEIAAQQATRPPTAANNALLVELATFKGSFALLVAALRTYLVTREPSFRFEYVAQLEINQKAWQTLQQQRQNLTSSQQERLQKVEQHRSQLLALPPQMFELVEGDRYRKDLYLFRNEAEPKAEEMLALLDEIVTEQQANLAAELQGGGKSLVAAQWQTFLGGAIALFLGILMAWILRRQIAEPIQRLTQVTTQIMAGDFDARAEFLSKDEIGTLAATFNQMTASLQQSRQELEQYSHTLEERVEARTQELQAKNRQLAQTLQDLQNAQAQLIQSEKMSSLGQMVAGVAHEINNPVSFIYGNLEYAQDYTNSLLELVQLYRQPHQDLGTEIAQKLEEIELDFILADLPKVLSSMKIGSERIRDIVLSLKNFSRLDEAQMKEVNIHEGLDNTLMILQNKLKARGKFNEIQVVKKYGKLPPVRCYAGQLNQVFMNILVNAVDALEAVRESGQMDEKEPQIAIATQVLAETSRIAIAIADNGPGVPPHVKEKLFDPFFTTKPVGKGTGLGLSISYQIIVEKHGGTLKCRSKLGEGSEFLIEIPIA